MKKILILLILILLNQLIFSINYKTKFDSLKTEIEIQEQIETNKHIFKAFKQEDGYPNISRIIFQDIDGFVWMSEWYPIFYRFDGVEFENMSDYYYHTLNDSLKSVLEIPDKGYFLIFKKHIIRKINDSIITKTFVPYGKITVKQDNNILYIQENDRIIKWENNKIESFEKENIYDFELDYSGNLYIVFKSGYAIWRKSGITEYKIPELNVDNRKVGIEPFVDSTLILSIKNQSENELQFCYLENENVERYEVSRNLNSNILTYDWEKFYPIDENYIGLFELDEKENKNIVIWSKKDNKIIDCNSIKNFPLDKITSIHIDNNGNKLIVGYQDKNYTLIKLSINGNRKDFPLKRDLSNKGKSDFRKNNLFFGYEYCQLDYGSAVRYEEVFFIKEEKFLSKYESNIGFSGTYNNYIYTTIKDNRTNINLYSSGEEQQFILPYKDNLNSCFILKNNSFILLGNSAIYLLTPVRYTKILKKMSISNICKIKNGYLLSNNKSNEFVTIDSLGKIKIEKMKLENIEFLWEDSLGDFWYKSEYKDDKTYYLKKNEKLIEINKYFDIDKIKHIMIDTYENIWILEKNSINEIRNGILINTIEFPDSLNCTMIQTAGSSYLIIKGKHKENKSSLLFNKRTQDYAAFYESDFIWGFEQDDEMHILTFYPNNRIFLELRSFNNSDYRNFKIQSKWKKIKFNTDYASKKILFDGQSKKKYIFFEPLWFRLTSIKNGVQKGYKAEDGLPTGKFISEAEDSNGNLWFAFTDVLARFLPETDNFISYSEEDGVPTNINDIESDEKGGLLIATDNGLVKFTEPEYNANLVISHFQADSLLFSPKEKIELSYKQNTVKAKFFAVTMQFPEKIKYSVFLKGLSEKWSEYTFLREKEYEKLPFGKYEFKYRAMLKKGKILNGPSLSFTIFPPWFKTWWFYTILSIIIISLLYAIYKERVRILEKTKEKLENEVEIRTHELSNANIELEEQSVLIIEKNTKLTDSIEYASLIQNSILPKEKEISQYIKNFFIIWKPKDIVGGDLYWFFPISNSNNYIISVIDCTGHGVPGAFMSMTANSILNNIVREKRIYEPDKILNLLHKEIRFTLRQQSKESQQDGMDISICHINVNLQEIHFSGAMQFLFLIKHKHSEIERIRGNRFSIGGRQKEEERIFAKQVIHYNSGDSIYLLSDGLGDQKVKIDGKETKFKIKRVKELLLKYNPLLMEEQKEKIEEELVELQGEIEQRDDIVVLGIKL